VAAVGIEELRGNPRRRRRESRIRGLFLVAAALAIVINVAILLSLLDGVIDFFRELVRGPGLSALWNDTGWFPRRNLFDVKTILIGTVIVSLIAMLVATPLGLGSAMYLSEYAGRRARRILKPILEILAGIPSVVMAYFVVSFISPDLVQRLFTEATFYNMLAAGIGVGILISPIVASVAEDAMHAVPATLREASFGLGAISGIAAALILGVSRAIGETLIVTIAAGATGGSAFTVDPLGPGQTMTAAMASLATGSDQVKGGTAAYPSLFFVGTLLFLLTLSLNLLSDRFVRRIRRRY
jgi:phosphate transport system permease protein